MRNKKEYEDKNNLNMKSKILELLKNKSKTTKHSYYIAIECDLEETKTEYYIINKTINNLIEEIENIK